MTRKVDAPAGCPFHVRTKTRAGFVECADVTLPVTTRQIEFLARERASARRRSQSVVRLVRTRHPSKVARKGLESIVLGSVAITTRALATVGLELTFTQWRVLVIADESSDGATVSEIATRTGAELSPASRLVSRMARRGLVTVRKDYRDRRVTRVTATDEGRKLRKAVFARRRALLADVLANSGPIEPEVEEAIKRIGSAFRRYT